MYLVRTNEEDPEKASKSILFDYVKEKSPLTIVK